MTEIDFGKNVSEAYFEFLVGGGGTYAAASHQGAIEMFWLHFLGAVMLSIIIVQWYNKSVIIKKHILFSKVDHEFTTSLKFTFGTIGCLPTHIQLAR